MTGRLPLGEGWDRRAEQIAWARTPGHDSYERFHRDAFLPLIPRPGRLTVEVGCGGGFCPPAGAEGYCLGCHGLCTRCSCRMATGRLICG